MLSIAVVLLNWNGAPLLSRFLPSVVAHSPNAAIYVADNASTDNSLDVLRASFPQVQIVELDKNYGYAGGYNRALSQLNEDVFVLLNTDVEVSAGWLDPFVHAFQSDPSLGLAQPKILDVRFPERFEYAGACGGFIDKFGFAFCRGRLFDTLETDRGQYDDVATVFWTSGACLFVKADVYRELGGLDEHFFAHQEEIDLCWRAFNAGFTAKCFPGSAVYHLGGATLSHASSRKTFLNFRNSLCMLLKNLPAAWLFPIIFSRLVLDGIAGIKFVLEGKPSHCWAVVRAHFAFYGSMAQMLKKRGQKQRTDYFKVQSIVYAYFARRKRYFSDLFNNSL